MSLLDEMLADMAVIESDMLSPTFTVVFVAASKTVVNQGPYNCIPSSHKEERILDDGGFSVNYDLVLSTQLDQFEGLYVPTEQDKVMYTEKTYRVVRINTQPIVGSYIRLFCESTNRGV